MGENWIEGTEKFIVWERNGESWEKNTWERWKKWGEKRARERIGGERRLKRKKWNDFSEELFIY